MADQKYPEWVWHDGAIVPWADATVHVMSHSLQYGSAIFEGIRCYKTPQGSAIFRLAAHMKRFYNSARIYDLPMPYSVDIVSSACHQILKRNGFDQAYLRPCAYRGLGGFGISADCPVSVTVAGWPLGPYLGAEALEQGITACVSSWQRMAPNTIPAGAKAAGNYLSGQLIAREARQRGFGEGIALSSAGFLSEGAGENLFLVMDGALHTAPVSAALLNGITRDSIIQLARARGIETVERDLPREYLYLADEIFMCGTASEVTPIRAIDGKQVGAGGAGPVTRKIQDLYFGLFEGRTEDKWGWLEAL
jgi:branched-chain amino acid aminotransferase